MMPAIMKRVFHILMVALMALSWLWFSQKGDKIEELKTELAAQHETGEDEDRIRELEDRIQAVEGERTFNGVLLTFVSAGVVGIFFVVYLLPFFAQRVTHAVYDSAEMVEKDVMHDARSLLAQGDYAGAIDAFKAAAANDPLNRLPWVEISKVYRDHLHDPVMAIQTIRHALESQEWEINDAAYFLFRLAEMHDEMEGDRVSAKAIMQQVVNDFPGTRHSANASHKLHEWSLQEAETRKAGGIVETAEEREYLAKRRAAEQAQEKAQATRYELPPADEDGV